jgi:hypothetical protein
LWDDEDGKEVKPGWKPRIAWVGEEEITSEKFAGEGYRRDGAVWV